jgi:hypothetical protein
MPILTMNRSKRVDGCGQQTWLQINFCSLWTQLLPNNSQLFPARQCTYLFSACILIVRLVHLLRKLYGNWKTLADCFWYLHGNGHFAPTAKLV